MFGKIAELKARRRLKNLVGDAELPRFSRTTFQVLEKLRDPDVDFDEVVQVLRWDPTLVVRVLRTVNSAAYGVQTRVEDVRHAVTLLGRSQVEQLVLAVAVKDALPSEPARGFDVVRFWRTAAFRATLGKTIAEKVDPSRAAEAFTSGLLQDLAIPVLAHARPVEYGPVLEQWHADPTVELSEIEEGRLGWGHTEVGGLLGSVWDLPERLVEEIQGHHGADGEAGRAQPATRLVGMLPEGDHEGSSEPMIEEARTLVGLEPDWVRQQICACRDRADSLANDLAA